MTAISQVLASGGLEDIPAEQVVAKEQVLQQNIGPSAQ
jgi:hypothetical protein